MIIFNFYFKMSKWKEQYFLFTKQHGQRHFVLEWLNNMEYKVSLRVSIPIRAKISYLRNNYQHICELCLLSTKNICLFKMRCFQFITVITGYQKGDNAVEYPEVYKLYIYYLAGVHPQSIFSQNDISQEGRRSQLS